MKKDVGITILYIIHIPIHYAIMMILYIRAWHLNWDTMKNWTSVLTRMEAVCYNSGLT